jgi:hypothetical protein
VTVLPIVTRERVAAEFREAGRYAGAVARLLLFSLGWIVAKSCRLVATSVAGVLFAVGWTASRLIWPALVWSGNAVKLGWRQGSRPHVKAG